MENKQSLIISIVVFAMIIFGAYFLYDSLESQIETDRLTENETNQTDGEDSDIQSIAPDFTVYDLDGNEVKLSDYFGKPIVLNFWASWCGPCKMEMPHFQEKYDELSESITFLMVNATGGRETFETAKGYIKSEGYSFPVLYDLDAEASSTYQVYSLPMTFFLNSDGEIVAYAKGTIDADVLQQGIDMIN